MSVIWIGARSRRGRRSGGARSPGDSDLRRVRCLSGSATCLADVRIDGDQVTTNPDDGDAGHATAAYIILSHCMDNAPEPDASKRLLPEKPQGTIDRWAGRRTSSSNGGTALGLRQSHDGEALRRVVAARFDHPACLRAR